jgi:hypothetical protein
MEKYEMSINIPLSNRGQEWKLFSEMVLEHIEKYSVPQYGDMPGDQASNWTPKDCVTAIAKYCSRFGCNSRDGQEKLDLMKMAHYACVAHSKMDDAVEETVTISKKEYEALIKGKSND